MSSKSLVISASSPAAASLTARLATLKPATVSAKRPRGRPPKIKAPVSQYKGTSQGPKPTPVNKLRDDGSLDARSPSILTETSSSEEEDSSEESEYEDEEEMPLIDVATVSTSTILLVNYGNLLQSRYHLRSPHGFTRLQKLI